jgi:threonine dehydrogenase-like Zn-dependent dehydrogenase
MPRTLYATGEREAVLRTEEEKSLAADELRVRMDLSAEKHGTTLPTFAGERDRTKRFDPERELFVETEDGAASDPFPFRLGNMGVGEVVETGSDVATFAVGDRVFGYLPIAETCVVGEDERLWPAPEGVADELLVCTDPATVALLSTRYGGFSLGDRVAVFGLGAIGLFAVQTCRLAGAAPVIGVDPLPERRALAESFGARETLDPTAVDAGRTLKELTGGAGVDVALEISGSYDALHHAVRGTTYGGNVVPVSFYHGDPTALDLSDEWHFNRLTMVSGARVESEPYRDHPRWDRERVYETVFECFERERLSADGILTAVALEEAPAAYERLADDPTDCLKLAVEY